MVCVLNLVVSFPKNIRRVCKNIKNISALKSDEESQTDIKFELKLNPNHSFRVFFFCFN